MAAHCSSCGAVILWAETEAGKRIPLDAVPVPGGNIEISRLNRTASQPPLAIVRGKPGGETDYVSHFATCKFASSHRRSKR